MLSFLLGGGEIKEFTPTEAAEWFAEKYLPDLRQVSVKFPEEKTDYGLEIQSPVGMSADEWKKKAETMNTEEKGEFETYITHYDGAEAEYKVWDYLKRIPESTRTVILHNYNVNMFQRFTGQAEGNQEFDFFLVFGDYRKIVHIEVKAAYKRAKGWVDQLKRGEEFFKEVLAAAGIDGKYWEFIPIGAFPNADNQKKVKGAPTFLHNNPSGRVITKEEITTPGSLEELLGLRKHQKFPIDELYLKLVNLLMASAHCSKSAASLSLTPSDPMEATKEKLIGHNAQDLDVGVSNDPGPSSVTVPFSSLKGKPVGSLDSILFWNKSQAQFLFQDVPRCLVKGDYGSGKTLAIFAKLKSLVENGCKVAFISCLLPRSMDKDDYGKWMNETPVEKRGKWHSLLVGSPSDGLTPIYDILMKRNIDALGENCKFYSAQEVCQKMGVEGFDNTEKSFYSVLDGFIQNLPKKFTTVILDEFGDNMIRDSPDWDLDEGYTDPFLKVTDSLAKASIINLIIALFPDCKMDDKKLENQGYKVTELKYIMRNTASIYKYEKSLTKSERDGLSSTVLGLHPVYISGNGDENFYRKVVEAVCERSRKFVCLTPGGTSFSYDDAKFKAELVKKDIKPFEYQTVGDEMKLEEFLKSREGCLITSYENARGTECSTLLVFEKVESDSRKLRGTTHLVVAQLDSNSIPHSVTEPEPGHVLIQGMMNDPSVWRSLVDKIEEIEGKRYILLFDWNNGDTMFLDELERRGLPRPVTKTKDTKSNYSVEDVKKHLQDIPGGVIYSRKDIEDNCLDWFVDSGRPIIVICETGYGKGDVERICEGNPSLFINVKLSYTRR